MTSTTTPRIRNGQVRTIKRKYLLADPLNWHTHPEEQRQALAAVFHEIGFVGHLLVRPAPGKRNRWYIVDGHERAEHFGPDDEVPCCVLDVDEAEARKLLKSYDPLGYLSGVDRQILDELSDQVTFDAEGLDDAIAATLAKLDPPPAIAEPELRPESSEPPIDQIGTLRKKWKVKRGQRWEIISQDEQRAHWLLCGDSRKAEDVGRVMGGAKTGILFTSPPYAQQRDYGEAQELVKDWDGLTHSPLR